MITLYDSRLSGNAWKVRLLLRQLGLPFERRTLDLSKREAATSAFLKLNPLARIPVVVLDDGAVLRESNAILQYFARGTPLLSDDPLQAAHVAEWLFFEQFDHLRYFARPRFLVAITKTASQHEQELEYLRSFGNKALNALEDQLASHDWLAGDSYSIADIALFAYTSMAEMGGYDLQPFGAIRAWLDRVRSQPGFVELLEN